MLGAIPVVVAGCDTQARESILSGLQSSTTTLLDALPDAVFQALTETVEPPITTM